MLNYFNQLKFTSAFPLNLPKRAIAKKGYLLNSIWWISPEFTPWHNAMHMTPC
jgi:hypothetical protein